ncbi:MAG TPA: O-antigen ligase family protein [Solirubrobacteraceae bacterium]|nr:O-antigen ligase family protein [Solirubrobacteraceae bacterium]
MTPQARGAVRGEQRFGALGRWQLGVAGAIVLGLLGGLLVHREPSAAILLCVVVVAILGLAMLGDKAFPWAIVIVAVLPWYPFLTEAAEAPIVKQKVLCSAVAAAALAPWLWSLAMGGRRTRPSRAALLMGFLFLGLAILIYENLHGLNAVIQSGIVGYVFIGVTFLCARRFGDGEGWPAASFAGLSLLILMAADAYVKNPSGRIGYFVGYPITYGALVAALLPSALLFASRRSLLLAAGLAGASAVMLIFSQSRSSWVAVVVMLIVVAVIQARAGNYRALRAIGAGIVILTVLILSTSSLHRLVEEKLAAKQVSSQSVTHREFSYSYGIHELGLRPIFGAEEPGFSGKESATKTDIGAVDNGYLSIAADMGLVGLIAAVIPIGVALRALSRCVRFRVTPTYDLSLALGIVGMAVVAAFYDSFYWAQLDLLLGAMGGVLSTRVARIGSEVSERELAAESDGDQTGEETPRWPEPERPLGWLGSSS